MTWWAAFIDWIQNLFKSSIIEEAPEEPSSDVDEAPDEISIVVSKPDQSSESLEDTPSTTPEVPVEKTRDTKYALLVGIDVYNDPKVGLQGCVADALQIKSVLLDRGFNENNIVLLTNEKATKNNILTELDKMITASVKGDELVFHFSGHGSQVPDINGDEVDKLDEVLIPHDFNWDGGYIVDDEIAAIFKKLPMGVFLSMISDSCHSGTISKDLNTMERFIVPPQEFLQAIFTTKNLITNSIGRREDGRPQRHVLLSGCKSTQTSMSVIIDNNWHGILTYSFVATLSEDDSWTSAYSKTVSKLKSLGYEQDPQLTGEKDLLNRKVFGGL